MVDDIRLSPEVELALVNAYLNLEDIAIEDSLVVVDPDKAIRLKYRDDSLFSFYPIDFVDIPNQDTIDFKLFPLLPGADIEVSLGTIADIELFEAVFDKGLLHFMLSAAAPYLTDVDVEVILKNATNNGSPVAYTVTLPAGQVSVSESFPIEGLTFDCTNNGQDVNYIGFSAQVLDGDSVSPNTQGLNLGITFTDLKIRNTTGYFGARSINIPDGDFDFDISAFSDFNDGFLLTNPTISLLISNEVGIDLAFNSDFDGVNNDGVLTALNANSQSVTGPMVLGNEVSSVLTFNKSNSDIVDFIGAMPNKIFYSGDVSLNDGQTRTENFIDKESQVVVGIDVDLPLELQIESLRMVEEIDNIDFITENPDEIDEVELIFYTENGFPIDLNVQVSLLDDVTGDSINGFDLKVLTAAPVNPNTGRVTQWVHSKESIVFTDLLIDDLSRASTIRLKAKLSTVNGGSQFVKLYTDYGVNIKIAAKAKLNLKLED